MIVFTITCWYIFSFSSLAILKPFKHNPHNLQIFPSVQKSFLHFFLVASVAPTRTPSYPNINKLFRHLSKIAYLWPQQNLHSIVFLNNTSPQDSFFLNDSSYSQLSQVSSAFNNWLTSCRCPFSHNNSSLLSAIASLLRPKSDCILKIVRIISCQSVL